LNQCVILAGLGIVALSVFAIVKLGHELAVVHYIPYVSIGIGALAVAGVLFRLATPKKRTAAIFIFLLLAGLLIAAAIGTGIAVLVSIGRLGNLKSNASTINDFDVAVFQECFVEPEFTPEQEPFCNETNTKENHSICNHSEDRFQDFVIDNMFCETLQQVKVDGMALVGPPPSGCSSPEDLTSSFQRFLRNRFLPIGIVLGILVTLLVFGLLASCCIVRKNKREKNQKHHFLTNFAQAQKDCLFLSFDIPPSQGLHKNQVKNF